MKSEVWRGGVGISARNGVPQMCVRRFPERNVASFVDARKGIARASPVAFGPFFAKYMDGLRIPAARPCIRVDPRRKSRLRMMQGECPAMRRHASFFGSLRINQANLYKRYQPV
ncbi:MULTISPECIES: hypothetical protein [unclassified Burkholderia]|uniref:hypothetical protein n=1 Tax=unclassified Burkholderia TaxID=2613784 RepID=UPI0015C65511|nr:MULTISPECIES: hypothetical protein [unclassified Burkholderia]